MSTDWRDAADLTGFEWPFSAYAPGDYMGVCHGCGDHVGGLDKRALLCLRCAMAAMRENYLALEQALRIRIWNDAKGKGISDRAAMVEVEEGIRKAAQWDRSGEADETRRGSAAGESPVDGEAGDAPDPLPPLTRRSPMDSREPREDHELAAFQYGVDQWMDACFGEPIKSDQLERADRFTEEALELAQTMPGFTKDRAHALVDYVFDRPQGEINQEVGGVMVTLAALCNTTGVQIEEAAATELARVWTKVEQIRAKQAAKPTGSALPVAALRRPSPVAESTPTDATAVEAEREACAKVADAWTATDPVSGQHAHMLAAGMREAAREIAAAIRSRATKES